ncbi:unnamed protein product [Hyaloperonospora brassicae]|uniref:Anaphase-promoting complex subunit 5 n=1 Tax=Hyaloperonospora brassicae TaxID=162125 RepID=A0AAV0TLN6_HYABA|nr:unnamed protein product [Hyaloperonospora brassicae]
MSKWTANSYILSICLLISEYVRQQQQDVKQTSSGDDSVASLVDAASAQTPDPALVMTRRSLNALARFLTLEIQHPKLMTNQRFTALHNLLQRLEISLDSPKDFEQLSWQLVSILTRMESPDAVWNTVEQISECVAPLQSSRDDADADEEMDVDSASSALVRTSLLGVFVRSFLLALNRLLFDGLSRLFDDVQQYLEEFREDVETEKKAAREMEEEEEMDNGLELVESPASQHLWKNTSKAADDDLLLSPIPLKSATLRSNVRQRTKNTRAGATLGSHALLEKSLENTAGREVNDPSIWSTDQLNYVLSDMVREVERGRSSPQQRGLPQTEGLLTDDHRRFLLDRMDGSNPNVLFVRYLSFLRNRDYQGALDSLHHYHDVLSPRQGSCVGDHKSSDGTSSASVPAEATRMHFRGSGVQYAALNLAGLQIVFHRYDAAHESIQEAIRVAQHHGDHICVAFALAWMVRIKQKVGASKGEVLQLAGSCLSRAKELRLPALQVLATLAESSGNGLRWVKSTEAVLDSVWNLSGKVMLSHAAAWSMFGHRSLEKVFSRVHSSCYGDSASTGEIALTVSHMAISNLAHAEEGVNVYVRALEFLLGVAAGETGAEDQRHLLNDATYQRTLHRLFFLWALDRGEFARAEVHLSAIVALSPQDNDFPAYLEAIMLQANMLTATGDYSRSLILLERLEVTCSEQGVAYLYAQVLLAISRTRVRAAAPHAPFASLNILLKSIDICRSHHYDLLLAEAHVVMAEVYIALGKLQDAYALMNDQMPFVMENGSVSLRGECLLVLAKTMVASIRRSEKCADALNVAASQAIKMLTASSGMFMLVQNQNKGAVTRPHSAHVESAQLPPF